MMAFWRSLPGCSLHENMEMVVSTPLHLRATKIAEIANYALSGAASKMHPFFLHIQAILWRFWKWLLHLLTGKCELYRLVTQPTPVQIKARRVGKVSG